MNVPNALTVLRLVLVPVFLWLLLENTTGSRWWALAVFAIAAYTDHLDGEIARKHNIITNFGKLADPLADKFLTLGAFIALSVLGDLTWWFTIIVAVREIGITILREVLRRRGTIVAASSGGKLKTVLQMVLIMMLIVPWDAFSNALILQLLLIVIWIIALAALVVTVWSGVQYAVVAAHAMKKQNGDEA
ncbi:CDP-diacylglycerol--glycerol-3-phosphate 3-phosphatidyltransferase [Schaalia sp. JY-X159]|uniref:CDP-diacylglycerol--glycerol-3-phosphate 3-phosphatidyltransferase n=1 Tax=Schaalia sp. JY-X159 TaxID=2758575 RepID=UPI002934FB28|nr:CDP-diacylglycerol--glycerol-3-phosphate 3-phosphatidyltransferase [Schaalia sp. JY-X159]